MERRTFIKATGITISSLALFDFKGLAQLFSDPSFKIRMLNDNTGIFLEKGGTILFQLNKEGAIFVDSQFPGSVKNLIEDVRKKSDKPFRLLINTHHHGDHSSGNIAFKGMIAHVLGHANSKNNQESAAKQQKKENEQLYPDQTFTDVWSEKIGKEKLSLHYFGAGHTNGDSIVQFKKSGIIHMGDLVFNRRHPYIDKTAGADIANWIKILERTVQTFPEKTTYVCGHAGEGHDVVIKSQDLLAFRDYLTNLLKFTEDQIKAGKTREEILTAREIPGSPEWKGEGIERPLAAAYQEITRYYK